MTPVINYWYILNLPPFGQHTTHLTTALRQDDPCLLSCILLRICLEWLTVLLVEEDPDLALLRVVQSFAHLANWLRHRVRTMQEVHGTRSLHDFGTRVPGHLTEAIIAENDRPPFKLSIGDHKFPICNQDKVKVEKYSLKEHSVSSLYCIQGEIWIMTPTV